MTFDQEIIVGSVVVAILIGVLIMLVVAWTK